jgi:pimeloyl-ACP methyl ester carboxylesterase
MKTIQTAWGAISYKAKGPPSEHRGPVGLLVHGAGGNAAAWDPVMDHFEFLFPIAVDLPGHGASTGKTCGSADEYARALDQLRISLGLDQVVVIGQSVGGMVAQYYARNFKEHCQAAVIVCSSPAFGITDEIIQMWATDWDARVELNYPQQVSPRASQDLVEAARKLVYQRKQDIFVADITAFRDSNSIEWAKEISVPTLLIAGYEDYLVPVSHSEILYKLIPDAEMAIIAPSGHDVMLEQPLRLVGVIESFIRKHFDVGA